MDKALRDSLVAAWKIFDERAIRFSESKHRATPETLKPEANRLVDLSTQYAEQLGLTLTQLTDLRQTWRRTGLGYEAALKAIEYGVGLRD